MPNIPSFLPGEKCFAKVKGFPHWPARINALPSDVKIPRGKYPIFFYGTHEVCFLPSSAIFSFDKHKSKFGSSRNSNGFNKGMEELEQSPDIYEFGKDSSSLKFLSQFYQFSLTKAKSSLKKCRSSTRSNTESIKTEPIEMESSAKSLNHNNSDGISEIETNSKSSSSNNDKVLIISLTDACNEIACNTQISIESGRGVNNNEDEGNITDTYFDSSNENKDPVKGESVLNDTASTICMGDLESENHNMNDNGLARNDCYINDFGNLLLEIRKHAWSTTPSSDPLTSLSNKMDCRQRLKKQRLDSKIRLFFPWYQIPKNK